MRTLSEYEEFQTLALDLFPEGVVLVIRPWKRPIRSGTASRRSEFAAGRACARAALAALGIHDAPLPRLADGAVGWPPRVVGSIAHTDGCCGAAIAWRAGYPGIGLDIEQGGGILRDRWALFCGPREIARLQAAAGDQAERLARILFTAKESAFKAARSAAIPIPDPPAVEVEMDMRAGTFFCPAHSIHGRLAVTAEIILAGAIVR